MSCPWCQSSDVEADVNRKGDLAAAEQESSPSPPRATRRAKGVLGTIIPGAVIVLMPKCPICVAAYLAAIGIGVSFSTASYLRAATIGICVAIILITIWKIFPRRRRVNAIAR